MFPLRCRIVRRTPSPRWPYNTTSRAYSSASSASDKSRHAQFYSDLVPGMIPVALLGSAVYLGLRLLQASLAQEKYLDEAEERVRQLEAEVEQLRKALPPDQTTGHVEAIAKSGSRWHLW